MAEAPLKTIGLSTGYRAKREKIVIARNMDAQLHAGELTCLLGPNGAGKSTLLRTLCGFLPAIEGSVEALGKPVDKYSPGDLARVISVVLTDRLSVANMTAEELVGMGRAPYTGFMGRLTARDRAVTRHAIELVGVEHLAKRAVATLSDGERQKVMIAKALAQETPVILLDEPTAFLDYPSKVEIMRLLHQLAHSKGIAVLLSTHDLELALQIADRIWLIDKKLGLTSGVSEDLALNGSLATYFEREGVEFDPYAGLFRIARKSTRPVRLRGNGRRYAMTAKALRRTGFTEGETGPYIIATDTELAIDSIPCGSIEALIDHLEQRG